VQRRRKHGWQKLFEFEEQPTSVHDLTDCCMLFSIVGLGLR